MLLEKQSVQAGVEAQPWEKGVEKDVEKTKTDKRAHSRVWAQPVFTVMVDHIFVIPLSQKLSINSKSGPRERYLKSYMEAIKITINSKLSTTNDD